MKRWFLGAALAASMAVMSSNAFAAGTLQLKTPAIQESSGSWHVKVMIDLTKPPATLHIPMRFTFAKTMIYERAIMEKGKEPVLNKLTQNPAQKHVVEMMVDFADPSGKVHKATIFEFDVKRSAGFFEAGEYQVTVSSPDGEIGTAQKLVLNGDNEPVYRGAITFDDKMKTVKRDQDGGTQTAQNNTPTTGPTSTEVAPVGTAESMIPGSAYNKTPEEEIKERPKGCGCAVPGTVGGSGAALGLALGATLVLRRRKR